MTKNISDTDNKVKKIALLEDDFFLLLDRFLAGRFFTDRFFNGGDFAFLEGIKK